MQFPPQIESLFLRVAPAWVDRALIIKVVSFGLIGFVNSGIDFGLFWLGHIYFGLPIIPANLIAWCVAVTNSYVLNTMFTFAAESGRQLNAKSFGAFAATQATGLVANTITVFALSFFMPVLLAKLFAIGVSFVVDFTLSHVLVFRKREEAPPH